MISFNDTIELATEGFADMRDITPDVRDVVRRSAVHDGIVCVAVPGSTGGVTTIEYEEGVLQDLKEALERLAPMRQHYHHDARWGDGNGFAHVRAALLGASETFPVIDGQVTLGTWQQIVLVDFDNRPRNRRVLVQVVGE